MRTPYPPVTDQDIEIGAYVCQDACLYQITAVGPTTVTLENCLTGATLSTYRESLTHPAFTYELVRRALAITAPDELSTTLN